MKLLPSGRPPEAQPCCKEPDSQVEVVTSHKTLRKQALLSAVKGVLTLFNRKVLNLHKQGSALRKVTPGLHTKRAGNTNIRHQILVLWKMTRGPEIYRLNTAPGLPYQDTQTWLPDGQAAPMPLFPGIPQTHSSTYLTALHQGWPPPPPPATQQPPPSSLSMGYGNQPTPNPEQDTLVGRVTF